MMRSRMAGFASMALAVGIAVGAILGPLGLGVIRFRTSASIENQFIGGEAVSLVAVAPIALWAGVLWLRGHRLGAPLVLGPALYAVYTYTTAVLGQEYSRYDGNVERFFPLYAALVAGGVMLAAHAWSDLGQKPTPAPSPRLRRVLAAVFLGIGGFFALAWAQQIWLVYRGSPPTEYVDGPGLFWLIKVLDFGFAIPALVTTGAGLVRQQEWAVRATYGLAPLVTCMAGSIASMALVMQVTGDPAAEPVMLIVLVPLTAALVAITVLLLRTYGRAESGSVEGTPDHIVTQLSYPSGR